MKKSIICILTVLVSLSFSAIAHADAPDETRVVGLLSSMGIIEKKNADNSMSEITRGEFANIAAKLIPYTITYAPDDRRYADVSPESEIYNSVMLLSEKGVVNGVSSVMFDPDTFISYNQACAILVRLLGYDIMVGGDNYISQASNIDLTDGVKTNEAGGMLKKDALRMIYNALFVKIKYSNSIDGQVSNNETLMEKRFDVYEVTGILTDDGKCAVSGESRIGKNNVSINDDLYINKADSTDMIGTYVYAYIRKNEGDREVIYMYTSDKRNNIVECLDENIAGYDNGLYEIYVDEEQNKSKKYRLDDNYKLIYNMQAVTGGISSDKFNALLTPKCGKVRLIDNNDDNRYDVVVVEDYKTVVVKGYSYDDMKLYNMLTDYEPGSFKDVDTVESENSAGIYLDISSVVKYNVVSIMRSINDKYAKLIISTDKVSGKLESVKSDEYIIIDGTEYKVAKEIFPKLNIPPMGSLVNAYVRHDGRIAYIEMANREGIYAYLYRVYYTSEANDEVGISIYTEDKEAKKSTLAKNVKIDGTRYKNPDKAYTYLVNHKYAINNLVILKFNEQDEVISIDCAYYVNDTSGFDVQGTKEDIKSLHVVPGMYNVYDKIETSILRNTVGVDETTRVFVVPTGVNKVIKSVADVDIDSIDINEADVMNTTAGIISMYDINNPYTAYTTDDDTMLAEAIIVYRNISGWDLNISNIAYRRPNAIVTGIKQTVNTDDEVCWEITYTTGGVPERVYTQTVNGNKCKLKGTEVKVGDIIKFGTNKSGRIPDDQLVIMYSPSTNKDELIFDSGYFQEGTISELAGKYTFGLIMGKVDDMTDRFLRILRNDDTKRVVPVSRMKYVVYDETARQKVSFGSWTDITTVLAAGASEASTIVFDWDGDNKAVYYAYIIK